jgi:quercetin dioxygenase-like cupin family protein
METANIYKDLVYKDSRPAITVLFQTDATKEVRIAFKQGQHMEEHQTPYPITVAMVEGELDFGVNGEVLHLVKGDMLNLDGGVPHDLLAQSDCLVRLTLSKSDSVQRVKDVATS